MTNSVLQGFRLSPQQTRLRALRRAAPELPLGVAGALRLRGSLDRAALGEALAAVAARHEILRTTFRVLPGDGGAVQVVGGRAPELEFRDLAGLPELERAAVEAASWSAVAGRLPDPEDAPPLRAVLFRRGEGDHLLHLGLPALCADAPTLDALAAELGVAYAELAGGSAAAEQDEPFQYVDFSEWLHETLDSADAEEGRAFWRRRPAAEEAALPELWPGAAQGGAGGGTAALPLLDAEGARRLDRAADAHGVDAGAWLLAAWRALLVRHLGGEGFAVGAAADGRAFEEMRGGLGPFTRYLPLPGDAPGDGPFAALAAATGDALRGARAWQAFHAWPAGNGHGPPHLRFGFHHAELASRSGRWGAVEWRMERRWHRTERFDLHLSTERVAEGPEAGVRATLHHDPTTLAPEGAARLLRRLAALLAGTLADPGAAVDALPLLDDGERAEVLGAAGTPDASFPVAEPLHRRFELQARRTPGAAALTCEGETLTYRELDERAGRLARHLRRLGVGPESRVGLCLERGTEMVVAILATLKAGGAYVPLDPAYPEDRLAFVVDDAEIRVLLVQEAVRERVPAGRARVVSLDADRERIAREEAGPLEGGAGADSLAYIIYTSGSTGRPKGVQVTHASVVRLFLATDAWFGFGADDVWSLFHSFAFDVSVCEIWGALLFGGRLVVVPFLTSRSPEEFYRLLSRERVTVLSQTPSAFRQLIAAEEAAGVSPELALRWVILAGEALDPAALRCWMERHGDDAPRVVNMYGITETTVHVTFRVVTREDAARGGRSPVGIPMPDLRIHVLDRRLEPVPVGVPGEMFVSGAGVARGYLGRPELTAERFVPDPFGEPGTRMYRSGDLARRLPAGELEYLGRIDQQVKIRGFRIEPGEIEAALLAHPGVREAAVVPREDASGERRLAAYLVAAGAAPAAGELRAHLRRSLPEYMVPSSFMALDRLPLTNNGKLDRRALPAPDFAAGGEAEYAAPATASEEVLAAVWAEVLGLERVGIDDSFFSVGGDSILSVRVAALARERGMEMDVADLFAHPTVRGLAAHLARSTPESATLEAILRRERRPFDLISEADRRRLPGDAEDAYPLVSLQAGMLYQQALNPEAPAYHNVDSYQFRGRFDEACFRAAVQRAVDRQENLRTSIHLAGFSEPLQVVHRHAEIPLRVEDVRHLDDAAQEALLAELREREFRTPFDLARAPLMRMHVHLRADDRFHLTLAENHAINDGWSLTSLFADIFEDQAALIRGEPLPERPLPGVRFRDFIELERATLDSEASRRFWAERLADRVPTVLPRRSAHARGGAAAGTELVGVDLPAELQDGLAALARSLAVPLKSVLLAAHLKVLGVSTGERDVTTGLATNGRPEVAGGTDARGLFTNTLPLRVRLGEGSWADLVRAAFRAETELLPHRRYPLAALQRDHGPERLFEVAFILVRFHSLAEVLRTGVVDVISGGDLGDTSHTLSVSARLHPVTSRILHFGFAYQLAEIGRDEALELADRYRRVMEAMVADPSARHDAFSALAEEERGRVLEEWNRTERPFPRGACIHELFEARARERPDAPALAWGGERLTYAELDARSNRLAHHLARRGVGPDARVGVLLERGVELVVSLLAVLKAGGGYVPLDPAYPEERLRLMLADSGARALLTRGGLRALAEGSGVPVVALDEAAEALAAEPEEAVRGGAAPESLAYVVYTSGSTGLPKGVMVSHRNVVQLVRETDYVRLGPGDRVAQASSASFDALTFEAWGALLNGATLVGVPREVLLSPPALRVFLREEEITTLYQTTALLNQLSREAPDVFAPLREVLFGGQAADADCVRGVLRGGPPRRLVHVYGPTETSAWCSWEQVEALPADARTVPVGRPTGNQRIYLLDAALEPVPIGVPGEAYVGGDGVVRGYLDRPALTAGRFLPDPFAAEPGARMYRTGDRLRWTAGGRLEFVGRVDEQVKIRGFRIEPGEIEAVLTAHPQVREARVVVREDEPGEKRLAAYWVGGADADALRAHLRRSLPEYMVPHAFVPLDAIPLTPGGKLDRRALPAPETAEGEDAYVAPRTPAEEVLAAIWADVLRLPRVGAEASFFELGGHSLLATRVVSRIREAFAAEMPLRALFEHPTVASLAAYLDAASGRSGAAPPLVAREPVGDPPLSFAQQRLWVVQRMEPESAAYNIPYTLRVRGALDAEVLGWALSALVARHEALRTVFPEVDGEPVQRVLPPAPVAPPREELAELPAGDREARALELAREEAARPFDLAEGPLLRVRLLGMGEDDALLLFTLHHVVSDGWSQDVLARDLSELYSAYADGREPVLPALPVQYADYAAWERRRLTPPVVEAQAAFWREALAGAPPLLELPTDRPRTGAPGARAGSRSFEISPGASAALRALARREGATLFMTLLAAFQALLARHAGHEDVVVGTPVAGRSRRETEELIGFFVNMLPLRTRLGGDPTFCELVARVRETVLDAHAHQDLPFEKLVDELQPERSLTHPPLFQVLFALDAPRREALRLGGLDAVPAAGGEEQAKFDLSLAMSERGGRIGGTLVYRRDLFDGATVERMAAQLARVLEQAAAAPDLRVAELELMDAAERRVVVEEWNRTAAEFPADACIHQLFEAQARRTPEAPAVLSGDRSLSFGQLDAWANRLAHHLRGAGVGPETRVGLCLERSLEMMVCILGVMKAGGAYVPMDPAHPAERIGYVLEDSGVALLLTQRALRDRLPVSEGVRVLYVDGAWEQLAGEPADAPESGATAENLCYVIYTSGSTGRPKGVAMHHRGVVNYIHWGIPAYGADTGSGAPVFSSMAVDLTITNLLPLFAGLPVRMLPEENPVEALAEVLRGRPGFGLVKITPVHLALLNTLLAPEELAGTARTLVVGADFLPAEPTVPWQDHAPGVRLMNEYGPTETVVGCSAYVLPGGAHRAGPVPVGRAIQNLAFYVLDARMGPVPVGCPGELYIGGVGVARGYLGRPGLSAEKFVPDPFAGGGARMYRTGDRARWLEGGSLMILGRVDNQVKIRGYRVEPGEIEATLRRHPEVSACLVTVREDVPGDRRLVAYVVGAADPAALREHLRRSLPEYMVPAAFVPLAALPRTPTGKLDPRALPAPDYASAEELHVAPRTPTEETLAEIWAETLGVERVGATDSFFLLGGHSLLVTRLLARVRSAFGVEVAFRTVFAMPTLEALAAEVERLVYEDVMAMSEDEAESLHGHAAGGD